MLGLAFVVEPFHGVPLSFEFEVGLLDPVDQRAGFQQVVVRVVDVRDQQERRFAQPRALQKGADATTSRIRSSVCGAVDERQRVRLELGRDDPHARNRRPERVLPATPETLDALLPERPEEPLEHDQHWVGFVRLAGTQRRERLVERSPPLPNYSPLTLLGPGRV